MSAQPAVDLILIKLIDNLSVEKRKHQQRHCGYQTQID